MGRGVLGRLCAALTAAVFVLALFGASPMFASISGSGTTDFVSEQAAIEARVKAKYGIILKNNSFSRETAVYTYRTIEKDLGLIPMELHNAVKKKWNKTFTIDVKIPEEGEPWGMSAYYSIDSNKITIIQHAGEFLHEYGHMVDYRALGSVVQEKFKSLCGGVPYSDKDTSKKWRDLTAEQSLAFTGYYALTSVREDIAETFAALFSKNERLWEIKQSDTLLGQKMRYLQSALESVAGAKFDIPAPAFEPSLSTKGIQVDGGAEIRIDDFSAYIGSGRGTLVKLRDIAALLNGTSKQFDVSYDAKAQASIITTGKPYQPAGGELALAEAAQKAVSSPAKLFVDGKEVPAKAYNIGGSICFQLKDIAKAVGFTVNGDDHWPELKITTK